MTNDDQKFLVQMYEERYRLEAMLTAVDKAIIVYKAQTPADRLLAEPKALAGAVGLPPIATTVAQAAGGAANTPAADPKAQPVGTAQTPVVTPDAQTAGVTQKAPSVEPDAAGVGRNAPAATAPKPPLPVRPAKSGPAVIPRAVSIPARDVGISIAAAAGEPIRATVETILHWAAARGITTLDLPRINAKRRQFMLPPFEVGRA